MIKTKTIPREVKKIMAGHKDWLELFPLAVTLGPMKDRPLLVLQDKNKEFNLPVWLGSLDATVAMVQANPNTLDSTPHKTTLQILKSLNLELTHCVFVDIVGHLQYVELCFKGPNGVQHVRCRADESMSLCLLAGARFFCPQTLIKKARDLEWEKNEYQIISSIAPMDTPLSNKQYLN